MYYLILLSVLSHCYPLIGAQTTEHDTYSCKTNITSLKNKVVDLKDYCVDRPCLSKCCGENEVIFYQTLDNKQNSSCTNINHFKNVKLSLDYSKLKIYKSNIETEIKSTNKSFKNFNLVKNEILLNTQCGFAWPFKFKGFILENGNFAGFLDNHQGIGWSFKEPENYCVDRIVVKMNNTLKSKIWFFVAKETPPDTTERIKFLSAGFLISSFFLLLVLLVYCMLPHLQNLSGMLLMAYVATLLLVYLTKTFHMLSPPLSPDICKNVFSPFLYFFFLTSVLWLNIMSFDVWWSFRGLRLLRNVNRKGELVKFGWYSLYVWGVGLAMTIAAVIIDHADLSRWPDIVKPSFETCLAVVASTSLLYYWYIPISTLILVNFVLFAMTLYNIWLVGKGINRFNGANKKIQNKSRFRLYLKMSLVMGISWGIEVAQSFYDDSNMPLWQFVLLNLYNTLIGVIIFMLFIFNRNTVVALCKRFNIKCKFVDSKINSSTKSTIVSRSQSSTNKGSTYTKTRSTEESDLELEE